jgi:glycosyltransferase involved in cell wall biosynthesis
LAKTKRVLLYSHNSNLSGAPISISLLAKELPNHGYDPLLVLPKPGPLERKLRRWGVPYRVLRRENGLLQLRGIIRAHDPVLVHINTIMKSCPAILARIMGRPVVWHVRENMGSKYRDARMIHLIANWVILICEDQHRLFASYPNVSVIHNGVEVDQFRDAEPADLNLPGRPRTVVVYAGSIQPRKGLLDMVRAASLLSDRPGIHFIVAGDAPEGDQYKKKVMDTMDALGVREQFTFLGYREDMPEVFAASTLFCFPAHMEPFGRVVIEAMASGLPVVGTRIGEVPHMVDHGETGYLVEPGDVDALAGAIRSLDDSPELGRRMGKAGFEKVEHRFSIQVHTSRVAEVYRTVAALDRSRTGRNGGQGKNG